MRAEGNIDADRVALRGQAFLQVAADAEQHLELERILGQADLLGVLLRKGDALLVMCAEGGDGREASVRA